MEAIAYARVSTSEQAEDSGALVKQMRRLRAAGATKIYFDIESRASDTRKGLAKLIEDINLSPSGAISKFLFIRIDRLTSSNNIFYSLMDALKKKGIEAIALDEPFDINSIGGELTIDVRLAAAKYEVKMLGMRVKKERDTRKQQHKAHWNAPLGYVVEGDRYKLDNREIICLLDKKKVLTRAQVARMIFDIFLEVGTINKTVVHLHKMFGIEAKAQSKSSNQKPNILTEDDEICLDTIKQITSGSVSVGYSGKALKWTVSGLRNTLVNPIYAGGTPYDLMVKSKGHKKPADQWSIFWGTHGNTSELEPNEFGATGEAIITREEYEQIKEIIRFNRNNRWASEQKHENPYAGLLKCAHCGAAYSRQSKKLVKKSNFVRHHYQCSFYRIGTCANGTMISSDKLEEQVIDYLAKEAIALSQFGQESQPVPENEELKQLKASLIQLETIPPLASIEKAKQEIKEQIAAIDQSTAAMTRQYLIAREIIVEAFSDPEYWRSLEPQDKSKILKGCIRKIMIDANQIKSIQFRF